MKIKLFDGKNETTKLKEGDCIACHVKKRAIFITCFRPADGGILWLRIEKAKAKEDDKGNKFWLQIERISYPSETFFSIIELISSIAGYQFKEINDYPGFKHVFQVVKIKKAKPKEGDIMTFCTKKTDCVKPNLSIRCLHPFFCGFSWITSKKSQKTKKGGNIPNRSAILIKEAGYPLATFISILELIASITGFVFEETKKYQQYYEHVYEITEIA